MSDNKGSDQIIPDHEYDGIHELDNPLPMWWLGTFYITILFSIFYVIIYHLGDGASIEENYRKEMAAVQQAQAEKGGGKGPGREALAALMGDTGQMKTGSAVYASKCASCHGAKGEGLIGPNLTDRYWIHGKGEITAIYDVIRDGVNAKGMPPWGPMLSGEELASVTAYVKSLEGRDVDGKGPQGDLVGE